MRKFIFRQFYKKYGSPGYIQLSDESKRLTLCQLFVEEYERLQTEGNTPTENLMDEAALALESRGIYLDRSRAPPKVSSTPYPLGHLYISTRSNQVQGFILLLAVQ